MDFSHYRLHSPQSTAHHQIENLCLKMMSPHSFTQMLRSRKFFTWFVSHRLADRFFHLKFENGGIEFRMYKCIWINLIMVNNFYAFFLIFKHFQYCWNSIILFNLPVAGTCSHCMENCKAGLCEILWSHVRIYGFYRIINWVLRYA